MARQNINIGALANDNTGDTLRTAGRKINETFVELYQALGGDSDILNISVSFTASGLSFEGSVDDNFETTLGVVNPTADRTILLPDSDGTLSFNFTAETLTNKIIDQPDIIRPDILDSVDAPYKLILIPGTLAKDTNLNIPDLTDSDTLVTNTSTNTLTNKTITSPTITQPLIDSNVLDGNGAVAFRIPAGASAINHLEFANASNGNAPTISAIGGDTNIDLKLSSKGSTGRVLVSSPLAMSSGTDYNTSGAISTEHSVAILNGTSGGAISMTLANGTANQLLKIININTGLATITPATFAQGTSFTLRGGFGVDCIYNTNNTAGGVAGWYIIGLDSSAGLGNVVNIT